MRAFNFSAGPGTLPVAILEEMAGELPIYKEIGSSVMEISHRSATYTEIAASARASLRRLLGMGDDWHIVFLQSGASMQFYQVPLNFLREDDSADYLDTGTWSAKAIKEALRVGRVNVPASSKDKNYSYIPTPDTWTLDAHAAYLHFTSNNTIFGTQYATEPEADVPLVCDASSDFLSRPIDLDKYGLIYAGAQKNVGPAGVTIVLIKDSFLQTRKPDLPTMLDYGTHTAKLFHTPPVYAVYAVEKVLRWLEDFGGLEAMQAQNETKAKVLYDAIDGTDFYSGAAREDSRSLMNVTFRIASGEDMEAKFLAEAKEAGLLALKGHRSVGGIRASIYNAMEPAGVDALVGFMKAFEQANG
ncbi:MAG: 3-phosphoserine/phosphohydroxythreonine transaminase [Bacteroidota bacterium]